MNLCQWGPFNYTETYVKNPYYFLDHHANKEATNNMNNIFSK